jgi:carbon storage regulator
MLVLTRKPNQSIMIGEEIEVSVVEVKGDQVKLGITAPRSVKVHRKEVFEAIQRENIDAARTLPGRVERIESMFRKKKQNGE